MRVDGWSAKATAALASSAAGVAWAESRVWIERVMGGSTKNHRRQAPSAAGAA